MDEVVIARNVKKAYGVRLEHQTVVLDQVNLTVERGDFVCVMGPSGAGKSTLLNVLTTIDRPTSGEVIINARKINDMSENQLCEFRHQNLGFIFQDFNLLDTLSVYENIAIPLIMAKENKKIIERSVQDIATQLKIEDLLKRYPTECSGGQRQRIAIARALITQPNLIVADEPTGNLDSQNSRDLMALFEEMNQRGTTILMVTHDPLVASYSKRLLYISDGIIKETIMRQNMKRNVYFQKIMEVTAKEQKPV